MATRTFSEEHASRARGLYEQGLGCNAIAKALGFAPSRISKWAKDAGLSFAREQTATAVRARSVDLAALRLELATEMGMAAKELLSARQQPYLVYAFGGKENEYNEHELDRPPVEVVRSIVATAGIAFDKASKYLEGAEAEDRVTQVSMAERVAAALGLND
jgi:hypothetical protein